MEPTSDVRYGRRLIMCRATQHWLIGNFERSPANRRSDNGPVGQSRKNEQMGNPGEIDDGRGLNERWERFRRPPVIAVRTGHLACPGDD